MRDLPPAESLRRIGSSVSLQNSLVSTNLWLRERAAELPDGAVCLAEFQSAGRGRLGRRWLVPRGSAVMCSVLLIERAGSPLLSLASLVGAVAACEAVEGAAECAPRVRWPNDIVLGGRKLGGVLAEVFALTSRGPGVHGIVLGIGLNCLQQRAHFDADELPNATSLEIECSQPVVRAAVASALLRRLDAWTVADRGVSTLRTDVLAAWRRRCEDFGRRIQLEHDGRRFDGTVLDVAEDGAIEVELDRGGRQRFAAATTTRSW